MRALFAAEPVKGMLRGEAEITFKYFGRGVSLPGVVQLLGPSLFRFDLLDPFDRPAAIIFSDSGPMVQFQPMAMTAAIIDPHPEGCGDVSPGGVGGGGSRRGSPPRQAGKLVPSFLDGAAPPGALHPGNAGAASRLPARGRRPVAVEGDMVLP